MFVNIVAPNFEWNPKTGINTTPILLHPVQFTINSFIPKVNSLALPAHCTNRPLTVPSERLSHPNRACGYRFACEMDCE